MWISSTPPSDAGVTNFSTSASPMDFAASNSGFSVLPVQMRSEERFRNLKYPTALRPTR